jgi:hypothetical protein
VGRAGAEAFLAARGNGGSPMTAGQAVANAADTKVIAGYPSLSREAAGALKLVWRLANIKDDWTKGGRIHDAWDRWTYWPYMAKLTYNPGRFQDR